MLRAGSQVANEGTLGRHKRVDGPAISGFADNMLRLGIGGEYTGASSRAAVREDMGSCEADKMTLITKFKV